jgi:hypothetical protein
MPWMHRTSRRAQPSRRQSRRCVGAIPASPCSSAKTPAPYRKRPRSCRRALSAPICAVGSKATTGRSPGTHEYEAHHEAHTRRALAGESLAHLLEPYEGAPEKTLKRRIAALEDSFVAALSSIDTVNRQLVQALGLEEEEEEEEPRSQLRRLGLDGLPAQGPGTCERPMPAERRPLGSASAPACRHPQGATEAERRDHSRLAGARWQLRLRLELELLDRIRGQGQPRSGCPHPRRADLHPDALRRMPAPRIRDRLWAAGETRGDGARANRIRAHAPAVGGDPGASESRWGARLRLLLGDPLGS